MDKMFFEVPTVYAEEPNTVWTLGRQWAHLQAGDVFEVYGPARNKPLHAVSVFTAKVVFVVTGTVETLFAQLPWALDQHHDPAIRGVEARLLRHLVDQRRRLPGDKVEVWFAHVTVVCFCLRWRTEGTLPISREGIGPAMRNEFCRHCGAGIGAYRREGEGTCSICDPEGCSALEGHVGPVNCS